MEKRKLTLMEEHFLECYRPLRKKLRYQIHRWFLPNCKICEANENLFKKLTKLTQKKEKKGGKN